MNWDWNCSFLDGRAQTTDFSHRWNYFHQDCPVRRRFGTWVSQIKAIRKFLSSEAIRKRLEDTVLWNLRFLLCYLRKARRKDRHKVESIVRDQVSHYTLSVFVSKNVSALWWYTFLQTFCRTVFSDNFCIQYLWRVLDWSINWCSFVWSVSGAVSNTGCQLG